MNNSRLTHTMTIQCSFIMCVCVYFMTGSSVTADKFDIKKSPASETYHSLSLFLLILKLIIDTSYLLINENHTDFLSLRLFY